MTGRVLTKSKVSAVVVRASVSKQIIKFPYIRNQALGVFNVFLLIIDYEHQLMFSDVFMNIIKYDACGCMDFADKNLI